MTNVRKRTLARPARNNLTTLSVTNLATQPEKQPGDTARKTTLTRPGGLAVHNEGGHLHRESAIEWRPSTNWLSSAPDPKPPLLNKPK